MNYRHIYHAGNFADVFKHIILCRIIEYMKRKEQAFRVIDTHAGIGRYDLSSSEAQKTGEWLEGVGRFLSKPAPIELNELLLPWLDGVRSFNRKPDRLMIYPGSPCLIRHNLRKQDRLTAVELHPADYRSLAKQFSGDYQARILHLDGWLSLGAHVPPKEKRGLILVDPPFEEAGEFDRIIEGLRKAYRRFSTGTYAFWYPVKHYKDVENFIKKLFDLQIPKILRLEMRIKQSTDIASMDGSGLIIVNPPYILEQEIIKLSPLLVERLGQDPKAKIIREWIRKETV